MTADRQGMAFCGIVQTVYCKDCVFNMDFVSFYLAKLSVFT